MTDLEKFTTELAPYAKSIIIVGSAAYNCTNTNSDRDIILISDDIQTLLHAVPFFKEITQPVTITQRLAFNSESYCFKGTYNQTLMSLAIYTPQTADAIYNLQPRNINYMRNTPNNVEIKLKSPSQQVISQTIKNEFKGPSLIHAWEPITIHDGKNTYFGPTVDALLKTPLILHDPHNLFAQSNKIFWKKVATTIIAQSGHKGLDECIRNPNDNTLTITRQRPFPNTVYEYIATQLANAKKQVNV